MRLVLVLLSVLAALVSGMPAQAAGSRRVALVVGNGSYRSVDRLANPGNDARLMAQTLKAAGFQLVGDGPQLDLDKARFDRVVQAFGRELQGADVALFYYSGHGMQVGGVNWLVPVDANPGNSRDLDFQMVDASLVLRQMEGSGTRLNMMVLDACRNNPFASRGVRATAGGLAEMRAPEGTIISYATQPGNVAADGGGANSPYTAALAAAMRQPGMDVFRVFNQVGLSVKEITGGQQQPWLSSSPVSGTFNFFSGPVTIVAPQLSEEAVFWQSVAASRSPGDFQAYLRRYPTGTFADLARTRLAGLTAVEAAAPGRSCRTQNFRGMTQPGGTSTRMQVAPGSGPCTIRIWVRLDPPRHYDVVNVEAAPHDGVVRTSAEGFSYQPRPGFVGSDSFSIVGTGQNEAGKPLTGHLQVQVDVTAAQ